MIFYSIYKLKNYYFYKKKRLFEEYLEIELGENPSFELEDELLLKEEVLKKVSCPTNLIDFKDGFIKKPLSINKPEADLVYPEESSEIDICQTIEIYLNNSRNDGKRGLKYFEWGVEDDFQLELDEPGLKEILE
jgi:hypothetical protein